jgi:hypothetical protein
VASFDAACKAFISDMCACGWCGRVALGGPHCALRGHMCKRQSSTQPPGLLASPLLGELVQPPSGGDWYWCCHACNTGPRGNKRREQQAQHLQAPVVEEISKATQPALDMYLKMLGMLLALPPGAGLQLAVLRASVQFTQHMRSYVHALQPDEQPSLLSVPLINWAPEEVSRRCACVVL